MPEDARVEKAGFGRHLPGVGRGERGLAENRQVGFFALPDDVMDQHAEVEKRFDLYPRLPLARIMPFQSGQQGEAEPSQDHLECPQLTSRIGLSDALNDFRQILPIPPFGFLRKMYKAFPEMCDVFPGYVRLLVNQQ